MPKMLVSIKGGDTKPEPLSIIQLWLDPKGDHVNLRGTDADGTDWYIASVYPDGLHINRNLPESAGWPTDEHGRMKLIDDMTGEPIE